MKRIFFFVSIMLLLASCGKGTIVASNESEEEVITQVKRTYSGSIDEIKVSGLLEVEVIKSDKEYVLLEGTDKLINSVKVKLNNGKLNIYRESKSIVSNLLSNNDNRVKVEIYHQGNLSKQNILESSGGGVKFITL